VLHGQDTYTCTIVFIIAFITRDLDYTLSNALQWVGTPEAPLFVLQVTKLGVEAWEQGY